MQSNHSFMLVQVHGGALNNLSFTNRVRIFHTNKTVTSETPSFPSLYRRRMNTTPTVCHVVAVPYPGRGHVNPMINLCKLLASKKDHIRITIVVTEEWLGFIASDPKPHQISFASIPNVLPSELVRSKNYPEFYDAVMTKMEAPFEELMGRIQPPVTVIIADTELLWAIPAGRRRNIPVASLWTASASVFATKCEELKMDLLDGELKLDQTGELGELEDPRVIKLAMECIAMVSKANYLLLSSVYELESKVVDTLRTECTFPVYPIGPAIPYLELECDNGLDYLKWLDSQPKDSVLYISLGSYLLVSSTQMDEFAAGLRKSGIRFLWVARGESARLKERSGDMGLVVPWCDQLKVLCHTSVGGFWTHCGWNSTLEAVFAGVPMLTSPLAFDQFPNSWRIVEEWKIGRQAVKREVEADQDSMTREDIADIVQSFMDLESSDGKEMRKRVKELSTLCHGATAKGGSSDKNLDDFIMDITKAAAI
ncbi:UDP-glycosyltransferase 87A1 isoform X2 [Rosa chinensis]|uniref:UDP-glycosyltransferase 87A1 isoform X2 n=1 Tax=Rosa chinensis TaxID=74649 RepID=UPI000D087B53|nr:UDP-glycosyltransferase 87A1 isoform X2 [Rosa chinensis]